MTDRDDDGDPLLVRPYLRDDPGGTAPPAAGPTWPEAAAEPVAAPEPAGATAVLPVAAPAPRGAGRRRLILVLAAALVLVLLGTAAAVWSLLPGPGLTSAGPVGAPLPAPLVSEPAPASTPAPTGREPETTAANRARPASSPTRTPSPAPTTARTSAAPAPPPAATSEPVPMLIPPPGDRVGRINGPGGLCLDLNGGVPADNNHIQVFTCNDTPAQVWTLAADGTLRVVGRCAVAADDGAVRITGCDGRRTAQWRAGQDRTLVNLAAGDCLTDPGTGTRVGAGVRTEDCSGAERQRWRLP
jgi:hypothetical protein